MIYKTLQKSKDWATQTPQKTEGELGCSGRVSSSSYSWTLVTPVVLLINDMYIIQYENHVGR